MSQIKQARSISKEPIVRYNINCLLLLLIALMWRLFIQVQESIFTRSKTFLESYFGGFTQESIFTYLWNNFEILSISGPNYTQNSNSKIYSYKKIIVISYKVICLQNAKCKFITLFSKHSLTMNTTCTRHQLLLFDYRSSLTTVILKVHSKYFYQD